MEALQSENLADIIAIADPSENSIKRAAESAPGAKMFNSLEQLLTTLGSELDGLVIATPSAGHAAQSISALELGIPVFCQKPLGRNAEEVERIVQIAKSADVLLGVDLSYRFTDGIQKIRKEIAKGNLGKIFAADLVFHNAYGPDKEWFYEAELSGGGCVIDLGTHLIDLAMAIIDSPVTDVSSRLFRSGQPINLGSAGTERTEVEDYAIARLDFASEATAQIACSWNLNAGQDAVITANFYGDRGGACLRNVNGSFIDFVAELFHGTSKTLLGQPPDAWGGRALIDWTVKLASGSRFDRGILHSIEVARVIDAIYQTVSIQRTAMSI